MDEFAERVGAAQTDMSDIPAVLFADGMLLTAKTPQGVLSLMDIATQWAEQRAMPWNTKRGKAKCWIRKKKGTRDSGWPENLCSKCQRSRNWESLSLSEHGIADTKLLDIIRGAKASVHQLRPLGVYAHGLSQMKAILL